MVDSRARTWLGKPLKTEFAASLVTALQASRAAGKGRGCGKTAFDVLGKLEPITLQVSLVIHHVIITVLPPSRPAMEMRAAVMWHQVAIYLINII